MDVQWIGRCHVSSGSLPILGESMVKTAESDTEIARCFDVMRELRPHLERDGFVGTVREMQASGYQLAYLEYQGRVVTVAGYRISTSLWLGRHLYIDDLVTASEARSAGHGRLLLAWLRQQAKTAGCRFIDLDSGTQRGGAHKFYFEHGFTISAYHFAESLDEA